MSDPQVITFGCRLNTLESEVIRDQARLAGLDDAVIVNTCAVTAEAERQSRQAIRRIRRQRPKSRIIVTGCAAQIDPGRFAAMDEVDRVLGNVEKLDSPSLAGGQRVAVGDIMSAAAAKAPMPGGFAARRRAFLQVQQGCAHRCSFCIVPFARGPARSVGQAEVVAQARRLAAGGHAEIVFTGVDISSYGLDVDGRPGLGRLARVVLDEVLELKRLRLSSLDPAIIDEALFQLLADEPRLMPHLHLSLQAGDAAVLKRMKRRHGPPEAEEFCRRARTARPDVVFGADLIAGFPTETEGMFARTLSCVGGLGLTYLHVFPFSPRPGTPAARMPQVPARAVKERAARLRAAGEAALERYLVSRIGAVTEVLLEEERSGHCRHYAPVRLDFDAPAGTIVEVRIGGVAGGRLLGSPAP